MTQLTRLLILIGLVLAGGFMRGSTTHAAGIPSQAQRDLRALVGAAHSRPGALSRAMTQTLELQGTTRGHIMREADTRSPARLSASDLALPASDFSGATIAQSGVITPSSSPFVALHPKGYVGAVGAYLENAGTTFGSGTLDMTLTYQGTLYSNSAAAAASYQDVLSLANSTTTPPSDCSSSYNGAPCFIVGIATTTQQWGPTTTVLSVGQVNQCTVETLTAVNSSLVTANENTIVAATAALFDAGMKNAETVCTASGAPSSSPTPTPTTPTSLAGVVVVPNGAQDTTTVLTHAKKGTKVEIVIGVLNARQGDQATITVTIKRSGKTLATRKGTDTFSNSGTIGLVANYTLPKKAGTIKITAKVTVDGSTLQTSTKFKVTKT